MEWRFFLFLKYFSFNIHFPVLQFCRMNFFKKHIFSKDKNFQMACFISLLIGVQGLIMALICLKDSNYGVVAVSFGYGTLMLATFFYTFFSKKLTVFYISAILMAFFLEIDFLVTGGTEGFGVIWITIIPLFTVYVLPYKGFFVMNSGAQIILILAMCTPLKKYFYQFSPTFETRFPIVYLVDFLFAAFLKYRINSTEKALQKQKDMLSFEIQQASRIQKVFFGQKKLDFENFRVAVKSVPMAGVTGDLYDLYPDTENIDRLFGAGVFDISGHGISSGIVTLLAKNIIKQEFYDNKKLPLGGVARKIDHRFVVEKGDLENYITGVFVRFDGEKTELLNAGHQPALLYKSYSTSFEYVKRSEDAFGPIGLSAIAPVYISTSLELHSGDELILFTDGIIDCENIEKKAFGRDALLELFNEVRELPIEEQLEKLFNKLEEFSSGTEEREDDMTLMIIQKK